MSSFQLAFSTVCPLVMLMALGVLLRRCGIFSEEFVERITALCFKVFLPVVLFQSVYASNFSTAFQPVLIVFAATSIVIVFTVLMVLVPRIGVRRDRRAVLVQGGFRSNFVLFGLPISLTLFGPDHLGPVSVLIAFIVPLFNILAVLAFALQGGKNVRPGTIVRDMVSNPLVIAGSAGIVCAAAGIHFPAVIETTVSQVSQVATPLSLIALGGSFSFGRAKLNWRPLAAVLGCRLVIVPIVFLAVSVMIGYRGPEFGALLALFASPGAVSGYPMAQEMGGDGELAGQLVAVGTVVSIVTIFAFVGVSASLGLFSANDTVAV